MRKREEKAKHNVAVTMKKVSKMFKTALYGTIYAITFIGHLQSFHSSLLSRCVMPLKVRWALNENLILNAPRFNEGKLEKIVCLGRSRVETKILLLKCPYRDTSTKLAEWRRRSHQAQDKIIKSNDVKTLKVQLKFDYRLVLLISLLIEAFNMLNSSLSI